jgi:ABC-2 type transport system permease protein
MHPITRLMTKRNKALLRQLVITDFKLRYRGSVIGYAWSLLRPMMIFAILYVVFARFLRLGKGVPHYPVYLLLGLVMWNFFADMAGQSLGSIVGRGDILRKMNIPRWIIPVSATISVFINLLFNLVVLAVFMAVTRVQVGAYTLLLPLSFLEVYVLGLGVSFFLAAAYVKYRDVSYAWEVFIQAGFYLTPIIYPLTRINNGHIRELILMNPLAQAVQNARYEAVTRTAVTVQSQFGNYYATLVPIVITLVILYVGSTYFKIESRTFAENL